MTLGERRAVEREARESLWFIEGELAKAADREGGQWERCLELMSGECLNLAALLTEIIVFERANKPKK